VIAVWLGANEASETWPLEHQAARLRDLALRLRGAAPSAACLIVGPLDRRQHAPDGTPFVPPALLGLVEAHRAVARELGCAYFDALAWQGGPGAIERFEAAEPPLVRPDRLHLTQAGYLRFAASLLRAILEPLADGSSPRSRDPR
jgi:lysophospholipase L1-like esterase